MESLLELYNSDCCSIEEVNLKERNSDESEISEHLLPGMFYVSASFFKSPVNQEKIEIS